MHWSGEINAGTVIAAIVLLIPVLRIYANQSVIKFQVNTLWGEFITKDRKRRISDRLSEGVSSSERESE